MPRTQPTAVELFDRFRPKFERITLVPTGWGNPLHSAVNAQRFYLKFLRDGNPFHGDLYYNHPYVDFAESGLDLSFVYDRSLPGTLHEQLKTQAAKSITERLLAGRTIILKPESPFGENAFEREGFASNDINRGFSLSVDGDPIPGLHLPPPGFSSGIFGPWHCFVPPASPESKAIFAAAQYHSVASISTREATEGRQQAKRELAAALAAV